jgi:hypothetical protein
MGKIKLGTGCLPRSRDKLGSSVGSGHFKVAGADWLIPENEWRDISLRPLVPVVDGRPVILYQGQTNECCPFANVACAHMLRRAQGLPFVHFSPAWIYRAVNGGEDGGSAISDVCHFVNTIGHLPLAMYPLTNWETPEPDGANAVAEENRIFEYWDIPGLLYLVSAIQRGSPVVIGVYWPGGGGHCVLAIGVKGTTNPKTMKIEIQNSYGFKWKDGGFGYLPASQVSRGIQVFGAFAPREITGRNEGLVLPACATTAA